MTLDIGGKAGSSASVLAEPRFHLQHAAGCNMLYRFGQGNLTVVKLVNLLFEVLGLCLLKQCPSHIQTRLCLVWFVKMAYCTANSVGIWRVGWC